MALDSSALGAASASSIWLKTTRTPDAPGSPAEDLELTGIMSILHVEDDHYRILFQLISRTEGTFNTPALGIRGVSPDNIISDNFTGPPNNVPLLGIRGIPSGFISSTVPRQ